MELVNILELLNNNKNFVKDYDAIIENFYNTKKIKITYKKNINSNNDNLVYSPDEFVKYSYNKQSYVNNYCYFYLSIEKGWFSTKIYINVICNSAYMKELVFEPYSVSINDINLDYGIIDFLYNTEWRIDNVTKNYTFVASNQYICSICKDKIVL